MEEDVKVDVPLKWLDFVWSLEELRHKDSRTSTSSDWFKLNPIEIVFLGCDAIIKNDQAFQKISNIGICMENIRDKILRKPRIFYWLISWMCSYSPTVNTKVRSLLIKMADVYEEDFRFRFWFNSCLTESLRNDEKAEDVLNLFQSRITHLSVDAILNVDSSEKIRSLTTILEGHRVFLLTLMVEHHGYNHVEQVWLEFKIEEILFLLKETSIDFQLSANQFLLLVEIVISHLTEDDYDLPLNQQHISEELNENVDNTSQCSDASDQPIFAVVKKVFVDILAFLRNCQKLILEDSEVPISLLRLVVVTLTDCSNDDIAKKINELNLKEMLLIFLEYSFNDRSKMQSVDILTGLLEFVTSGFEMEIPKATLFGVTLPNLLSLGFGAGNNETICLLLEYGSLACRSKNMKHLFSNSLWYIKSSSELFQSHDQKKMEHKVVACQLERLEIVSKIIDELLSAVVSNETSLEPAVGTRIDSQQVETTGDLITDHEARKLTVETCMDNQTVTTQELLNLLLQLACEIIKTGDNLNYIYANVIPRLFQRTDIPVIPKQYLKYFPGLVSKPSTIPWKIPKEVLAEKTLQLCIECVRNGKSTPFQICGILLPKLVKNLDMTTLSDSSKYNVVLEIIDMCLAKVSENSVELLLSYGLDFISSLLPQTGQHVQVEDFFHEVLRSIEKISQSTSLLFLKTSLELFLSKEEANRENVKALFLHLLKRSNRNDIRNVYLLSKPWFFEERFNTLRSFLYTYSTGCLKSKPLQAFAEIVTDIMKTEERFLAYFHQENTQSKVSVSQSVAETFLSTLTFCIEKNCFTAKRQEEMKRQLSRLSMVFALFPGKVVSNLHDTTGKENWLQQLEDDIPPDIISDGYIMSVLQTCCKRINHMQVPRYQKLKDLLIGVLRDFIFSDFNEANDCDKLRTSQKQLTGLNTHAAVEENSNCEDKSLTLQQRIEALEHKLSTYPWNASKKNDLLSFGYNLKLWSEPAVSVTVQTNGELNLEENLRQTLLSCFMEYHELLRHLGIRSVTIDGKATNVDDIFSDEFSLTELKGRRAIVVKAIDKSSLQHHDQRTIEKKTELLLQEETIERKIESMAEKPKKVTTFAVKLNMKFFDCAMCCGPQIIGCYSPSSGDHCERPLEIGYRVDSAFASIYNSEGVEIENSELLFTKYGVYMYKGYSSGHPYDTAEVWLQFFIEILDKRQLVPAIILPRHFPNRSTWEALRRFVSPDITGTIFNVDFDCSSEWRSYYDFRPESFGYGKDIVLTKGFCNTERKTSFSYQRQISCNTNKDLASMIFEFVMDKLLEDEYFQTFRFLSKHLLMFLNDLIDSGSPSPEIIDNNFDYNRWLKRQELHVVATKEVIVGKLVDFVYENTSDYLSTLDYSVLLNSRPTQYLQLKVFLEKNCKSTRPFDLSRNLSSKLVNLLQSHLHTVAIGDFHSSFQEELIHWIFENEDRVWRHRGGRDGHETLNQYLEFLKPNVGKNKSFPGVVVCLGRRNQVLLLDAVQIKDVVAYAVGEYVYPEDEDREEIAPSGLEAHKRNFQATGEYYEIVTAWVKPRFRGAQLSMSMYMRIFDLADCNIVVFDILQNSLNNILRSSSLLRMIHSAGLTRFVVKDQTPSYDVTTEFGREQFERVVIARKFLVYSVRGIKWLHAYWLHFAIFIMSIAISFIFSFI